MSHFDAVAHEWDRGDTRQRIAEATARAVFENIPLQNGMDLLDFGAGTGLLSFRLLPRVRSVTAVDLSEKMLEVLRAKRAPGDRIETITQDILEQPLDRRFDGIVSSMAMHHVPDTAALMRTFYKHLNPGGFLAVADLDEEDGTFHSRGNDGVHHFGFDREALRTVTAEAGFRDIGFTTVLNIEKPYGTYPVFLLNARKN